MGNAAAPACAEPSSRVAAEDAARIFTIVSSGNFPAFNHFCSQHDPTDTFPLRTPRGENLLHAAARAPDHAILELLLNLRFPVIKDNDQNTPLHAAISCNASRAGQLDQKNADGLTPLMLAQRLQRTHMIPLLQKEEALLSIPAGSMKEAGFPYDQENYIPHSRLALEGGEESFSGTQGDVVPARLQQLEEGAPPRLVALKLVRVQEHSRSMLREIELLSRADLKHPNIICLEGISVVRSSIALVFPYSSLGDLHKYTCGSTPSSSPSSKLPSSRSIAPFPASPSSPTTAPTTSSSSSPPSSHRIPDFDLVAVMIGLAHGLHHLHSANVFHNDVKPQNVVLFREAEGAPLSPKLIDFGIAFMSDQMGTGDQTFELTPLKSVGTRGFAAPERLFPAEADRPPPNAATDTFSFGVTCWQAYHAQTPFQAGRGPGDVLQLLPLDDPSRSFPPELLALINRCLASNPANRPCLDEFFKIDSASNFKL